MTSRQGIIAGGNWIVDQVKTIDTWPPQDALANILDEVRGNGGSPYNVLKDLAKLGARGPLEAVGLIGDDPNGRYIGEDCAAHGIDCTQLRTIRNAPTSYTDVMTVKAGGRRTFFHQRGANALLGPEHFDFSLSRAAHFHLGYALLLDRLDAADAAGTPRLADVLRRARLAGMRTSLDCVSESSDRFDSVIMPVLSEVDLLFLNDFEAEKLTHRPLRQGAKLIASFVKAAGQRLLERGVCEAVVIHFPEGACVCTADQPPVWQPSVNILPHNIAGAAGAGDAFAAGVLYVLLEGGSWQKALHLGVCVAASSLLHPTCSDSVGTAKACLDMGRTLSFRCVP